jgi:hypothetical protein
MKRTKPERECSLRGIPYHRNPISSNLRRLFGAYFFSILSLHFFRGSHCDILCTMLGSILQESGSAHLFFILFSFSSLDYVTLVDLSLNLLTLSSVHPPTL